MNSSLLSLSNCANSSAWLRTSIPAQSRPSRISAMCSRRENILVFLSKKHHSTSDDWRKPELRRSKLQVLLWAYLQEHLIYNCQKEKIGSSLWSCGAQDTAPVKISLQQAKFEYFPISQMAKFSLYGAILGNLIKFSPKSCKPIECPGKYKDWLQPKENSSLLDNCHTCLGWSFPAHIYRYLHRERNNLKI